MKSQFYDTYFMRYSNDVTSEMINNRIKQLDSEIQISIHDIIASSKPEQIHMIDAILTAERVRLYEKSKQKECYVHFIRFSERGYLLIVSVYPDGGVANKLEHILKILCDKNSLSSMDTVLKGEDCDIYWKQYMRGLMNTEKYSRTEEYIWDTDEYLPIDNSCINSFKEMFKKSPMRAKAVLTCAFARVVSFGIKRDSVILEDHIVNGRLNRLPIRVKNLTSEVPINDTKDALCNAFRYGNTSYNRIKSFVQSNMEEYAAYSQAVLYDKMYENLIKNTTTGCIYKIDAFSYSNTPMFVMFHLNNDVPAVRYLYDKTVLRDYDIRDLHNAFMTTLERFTGLDYTVIDYAPLFVKSKSMVDKKRDVIVNCFKKSGWFNDYTENGLIRLAEKSSIKRLFKEQNFVDAGTKEDSVYLLVHGKVEVVGRDSSNILHSLRIIKEMKFFGLESISENTVSSVDYQVVTDDALAIVISRDDFIAEAARHNELYQSVIAQQNTEISKLQKLWMMS